MMHEEISLEVMNTFKDEFKGALDLPIAIFTNKYKRKFMHQLIVGQIDLDRMDYLKRDSFYSGATEGNINSKRIIEMMVVVDDQLAFEEKSIYSIEKFLMARRLMYWQVYLHKTSLSAEFFTVQNFRKGSFLLSKWTSTIGLQAFGLFFVSQ
jgi:HD superfamily phosphohydrolase